MLAKPGAALLEVLIALTILAVAGVSTLSLATETIGAVQVAREAEAEIVAASAFLEAVALWPREDLDRRLGERAQGPWVLRIDRSLPTVYTVVLSDSASGRLLLRTALFRPESRDAGP